ncbi:MAG: SH3 domain-containing protein, partial [Clostridia bacterium]|nr:SH3 domain-containing protein [Clostridia bacterium]
YSSPTYPEIETPDYNGKYDMWQFTNRGSVKGIDGNCDLIVSYKKFKEATAKDENAKLPTASIPKTEEEKLYTDVSDKVTAKEVTNLRAGAGTNFEIVGTLKSGEFVKRTGVGKNGWSRLKYNGKTVYAITSYLTDEVIEIPQKDIVNGMEFTPKNDKVTAKIEVNLRSLPTTDSESVGKLLSGTFLKRTAISNNGWSRLDYNGKTVYAVSSYLTTEKTEISIVPSEDDEIKEHGMVFMKVKETRVTAKEITNLRDKPSTDSNIVHALQNGEYVIRNALSSNGWARIEYDGKIVYAVDSFLLNAE